MAVELVRIKLEGGGGKKAVGGGVLAAAADVKRRWKEAFIFVHHVDA